MSYEICVLDPQLAATKQAAFNAWDDGAYTDNSLPDTDRSAPKWRIRESLAEFNPSLSWTEPASPRTGLFAALMGKRQPERVALIGVVPAGLESTSYCIFDHAVEVDLPWGPDLDQTDAIVRDLWRHLEKLSQLGLSAIYDTERDVMLDLATDFDAVLKRYIKNVSDGDEDTGEATPQDSRSSTAFMPGRRAAPTRDSAFTGNAGDSKPWWKIW